MTLAFLTPTSEVFSLNSLCAQDVGLTNGLRNFHLFKADLPLLCGFLHIQIRSDQSG
jgi:hypothetical protein